MQRESLIRGEACTQCIYRVINQLLKIRKVMYDFHMSVKGPLLHLTIIAIISKSDTQARHVMYLALNITMYCYLLRNVQFPAVSGVRVESVPFPVTDRHELRVGNGGGYKMNVNLLKGLKQCSWEWLWRMVMDLGMRDGVLRIYIVL